jgi:hypothetical protein
MGIFNKPNQLTGAISHSIASIAPNAMGIANNSITTTGTGYGNILAGGWGNAVPSTGYSNSCVISTPLTHNFGDGHSFLHEIAVIKVTRNDNMKIISSKMVKTFWVETHTHESIEFAASKDPEVAKFEPNEIIIKTLRTIIL